MGGQSCKRETGERRDKAKTDADQSPMFTKILAYKGGKLISHRYTINVCHQPVSNLSDSTSLARRCQSLLSLESLSLSAGISVLEKKSNGDRTIESSRWEGSRSGGPILSGREV